MSFPETAMLERLWRQRRFVIYPRRVTIETIFGCNAHCRMCPIQMPTKRKKGPMPQDLFREVIDSLVPVQKHLEMMDLYCLGEPLLDPFIMERIRYVKEKRFRNVAICTNADLLNEDKQRELLEAGIDTVLFSIDGARKETHEDIRRGTAFDNVVANCESFIRHRNDGDYVTRVVIRFIRQDRNRTEWDEYRERWSQVIDRARCDFVTAYDVHTWGGMVDSKQKRLGADAVVEAVERRACPDIFDILYVLSDGSVPLCHEDWLHPDFNFGNVRQRSAIDIFNDEAFHKIRDMHLSGARTCLEKCRECTCLYSAAKKEIA